MPRGVYYGDVDTVCSSAISLGYSPSIRSGPHLSPAPTHCGIPVRRREPAWTSKDGDDRPPGRPSERRFTFGRNPADVAACCGRQRRFKPCDLRFIEQLPGDSTPPRSAPAGTCYINVHGRRRPDLITSVEHLYHVCGQPCRPEMTATTTAAVLVFFPVAFM